MPRYYFDSYEHGRITRDDFGIDLLDVHEARDQAVALLPDMARQELPAHESQRFAVIVRDGSANLVYGASMTFRGYWYVGPEQNWSLTPEFDPSGFLQGFHALKVLHAGALSSSRDAVALGRNAIAGCRQTIRDTQALIRQTHTALDASRLVLST